MESKMFNMKGKLGLVKQRIFRLFRGLENDDSIASSSSPALTVASHELAKPFSRDLLEVEFKKAQALMYSRMLDRPR